MGCRRLKKGSCSQQDTQDMKAGHVISESSLSWLCGLCMLATYVNIGNGLVDRRHTADEDECCGNGGYGLENRKTMVLIFVNS